MGGGASDAGATPASWPGGLARPRRGCRVGAHVPGRRRRVVPSGGTRACWERRSGSHASAAPSWRPRSSSPRRAGGIGLLAARGLAAARGTARTGVEAVRQVLRRHDERTRKKGARSSAPALAGERDRRVFWRAWRRVRGGWRRGGVSRAWSGDRGGAGGGLRRAAAGGVASPRGRRSARRAAGRRGAPGETDLASFLADARVRRVPVASAEMARARAYRAAVALAAAEIAALDPQFPSATGLDPAETLLRPGGTLGAELVRTHLGLMVQTLEGAGAAGRIAPHAAAAGPAGHGDGGDGRGVEHFDPFRASRRGRPGARWGWQPTGRRRRGSGRTGR